MRITQGKYRGREVAAPPGRSTRPALTRVRQALFDTLRPWLADGAAVLDLFAGSGAFVFEALSRGAARATAVDLDARAAATIRANARALEVDEPVEVVRGDALEVIPRLAGAGARFDLILVAPPYWQDLQPRALALVDASADALLAPDGLVIVQRDRKERCIVPPLTRLEPGRERAYGNTVFAFYAERPRDLPHVQPAPPASDLP